MQRTASGTWRGFLYVFNISFQLPSLVFHEWMKWGTWYKCKPKPLLIIFVRPATRCFQQVRELQLYLCCLRNAGLLFIGKNGCVNGLYTAENLAHGFYLCLTKYFDGCSECQKFDTQCVHDPLSTHSNAHFCMFLTQEQPLMMVKVIVQQPTASRVDHPSPIPLQISRKHQRHLGIT